MDRVGVGSVVDVRNIVDRNGSLEAANLGVWSE